MLVGELVEAELIVAVYEELTSSIILCDGLCCRQFDAFPFFIDADAKIVFRYNLKGTGMLYLLLVEEVKTEGSVRRINSVRSFNVFILIVFLCFAFAYIGVSLFANFFFSPVGWL